MTSPRRPAVFGGEHGLAADVLHQRPATSFRRVLARHLPGITWFASGRDAWFALRQALAPARLWLPDFLCRSLVYPGISGHPDPRSYRIDVELRADLGSLNPAPGDTVLVINYFGAIDGALYAHLRDRRAVIVTDATHSLLDGSGFSRICRDSEFVFGSLRKLGPFPDLAFLGSRPRPDFCRPGPMREEFWAIRAGALLARQVCLEAGQDDVVNVRAIEAAEKRLDDADVFGLGPSPLSLHLAECLDLGWMRRRARRNVAALRSALARLTELRGIDGGQQAGPFFPLRFSDQQGRDAVRQRLRNERRFCPVHWPTDFLTQPHPLSARLLSLPCDYRYSPAQVIATLNYMAQATGG